MITTEQIQNVIGQTMHGSDGEKIGKIGQVFLDDQSGQPEWATTKTGMFGSNESFVPLAEARVSGDELTVPYDKDTIKNAPRIDPDQGHVSQAEEAELYRYYGLDYAESQSDSGLPTGEQYDQTGEVSNVGSDVSGPATDDAMTRSEEQIRVGTEKREAGRARLRKYIVTENVTQTVPVSREEVRVEREPITEANRDAAMAGSDLTEEEHEVTLHEERAVVDKEAVPVERVRMDKDTVTGQEQVSEEVRKEQIEAEGTEQRDR
ncbi:MAG: PRC and DUF2382 domain-containing protein [Nocardioidaceae bacterium]|nr:PRC and DUF2382 domain-containing protein [Nocardioidaceae bacterium]